MGQEISSLVIASCKERSLNLKSTLGTDADSNILKIYRMLDRNNGSDKHYYQVNASVLVLRDQS